MSLMSFKNELSKENISRRMVWAVAGALFLLAVSYSLIVMVNGLLLSGR